MHSTIGAHQAESGPANRETAISLPCPCVLGSAVPRSCRGQFGQLRWKPADLTFAKKRSRLELRVSAHKRGSFLDKHWRFLCPSNARRTEPTCHGNAVAGPHDISGNSIKTGCGDAHPIPCHDVTSAQLPRIQGSQNRYRPSQGHKPVWQQLLAAIGWAAAASLSLAFVGPPPCRAQELAHVAATNIVGQASHTGGHTDRIIGKAESIAGQGGSDASSHPVADCQLARTRGNPVCSVSASLHGADSAHPRANGKISSALEKIIVDFCPRRETDVFSEMTLWRFLVEEAEYAVSIFLENNPFSKALILALITALLTAVGSVAYYCVTPPGRRSDLLREMWTAWTMVVDSGTHTMETDIRRRLVGVPLTIGGMLFFALLVGLVSEGVSATMDNIQQGNFRVREADHVIILGWTPKSPPLVKQLCMAYSTKKKIVVLGLSDKKAMASQLEQVIPNFRRKRAVTLRTGNPDLQADVLRCGATTASHIVVLSTCEDPDTSDAKVVESCLMLDQLLFSATRGARRRDPPAVVAEFHEPRKFSLLTSQWLTARSMGRGLGGSGSVPQEGAVGEALEGGMGAGAGDSMGSVPRGAMDADVEVGDESGADGSSFENGFGYDSGSTLGTAVVSDGFDTINPPFVSSAAVGSTGCDDMGSTGCDDIDDTMAGPRPRTQLGGQGGVAAPAGLFLAARTPLLGETAAMPMTTATFRIVPGVPASQSNADVRLVQGKVGGYREGAGDGYHRATHHAPVHVGYHQFVHDHPGQEHAQRFHHHRPSLPHTHSPHHGHHRGHHHRRDALPLPAHTPGASKRSILPDVTPAPLLEGTASFQVGMHRDCLIHGCTNQVVVVPEWGLSGLRLIMAATGDLASKLLVQKIYEPDVAAVLRHLLTYEGCEIYEHAWPQLEGHTFGETMLLTQGAVPMGLYRAASNHYVLNPGRDVVIEKGDRLIVLCEDNTSYSIRAAPDAPGRRSDGTSSSTTTKQRSKEPSNEPSSEQSGGGEAGGNKPSSLDATVASNTSGTPPNASSPGGNQHEEAAQSLPPAPAVTPLAAGDQQKPNSFSATTGAPGAAPLRAATPEMGAGQSAPPNAQPIRENPQRNAMVTSHGPATVTSLNPATMASHGPDLSAHEWEHGMPPGGGYPPEPVGEMPTPEKLLVAGWRPGMHTLLAHLAELLPAGSEVTLLNSVPCDRLSGWPRSLTLHHIPGDPSSMDVLGGLPLESYDRVVVVGTRGDREALTAAVYITHLQHARGRFDARLVLELKATLAESSHMVRSLFRDSVVLPNEIKGMILAHLVENVYMGCLLTTFVTDTSPMEIRTASAQRFAAAGEAVSVSELMSRALDRNEIILGYRRTASVATLAAQDGLHGDRPDVDLVLNPLDKDTKLQWGPQDSLIVLGARHASAF